MSTCPLDPGSTVGAGTAPGQERRVLLSMENATSDSMMGLQVRLSRDTWSHRTGARSRASASWRDGVQVRVAHGGPYNRRTLDNIKHAGVAQASN
jgi:hypothetical protein